MATRSIAMALCAVVLMAVPAQASEHTFVGTAEATALKLTLTPPDGEPQGLTFGASTATVQSTPSDTCEGTACATGAAAVEPFGETASVAITTGREEETAQAFSVPPELQPLLAGELGTGVAAADAEVPSASGSATAGELGVYLLNADELDAARAALTDGAEQIREGLAPILGQTPDQLQGPVDGLIDALINALEADLPLVTATIGDSTSDAEDDGTTTTATATAVGSVISIAPTPAVAEDGLFRITVGEASATASTDGTTGTTSSKGSVVKLEVADLVTPAGDDYHEVDIATDQAEECFGESPLMMCIILGGTAESGEGPEAGAVAAGVRILALADADPDQGNPLPGVTLAVAEAIAGVNAQIGTDAEPVAPPAEDDPDEPTLPATGGGMAALGLAVLTAGGAMALRLRRHT